MADIPAKLFTGLRQRKGSGNIAQFPPSFEESFDPQEVPGSNDFVETPPVAIRYASDTAMFADQVNQKSGFLYFDGTDTYWYLGTTNGNITDYEVFGSGGVESVTGDGVDNTDPANPVISYPTPSDIGAIGGTIASGQVAFGSVSNEIKGVATFVYNEGSAILEIGTSLNAKIRGTGGTVIISSQSGDLRLRPDGDTLSSNEVSIKTAGVGVNTSSPTNTLDVNGTARIRTVANLGIASTEVLVPSATGVVSKRTVSEFKSDLGLSSAITGTIASGQVAFGTGAGVIGGDSSFIWDSINNNLSIGDSGNTLFRIAKDGVSESGIEFFRGANIDTIIKSNSGENLIIGVDNANVFGGKQIVFQNKGVNTWVINTTGILQSNGAQTIQTSTGNLTLQGNGGNVGIGTADPTSLLDVNGTARIRTISNLGVASTEVLVPSATGVVSKRTLAEFVSDLSPNFDDRYVRKDVADTKVGNLTFTNAAIINGHIDVNGSTSASAGTALNRFRNASAASGITQFFGTNGGSSRQHFAFYGSGDVEYISFGNGWVTSNVPTAYFRNPILVNGISFLDSSNIILNTTTGTKIGTATAQKLSFWNKTPIIQPTTGITGATRIGGGGATITDTDTFGGYTLAQIAQALINTGLLA